MDHSAMLAIVDAVTRLMAMLGGDPAGGMAPGGLDISIGQGLAGSAIGAFATTLVVGAILIAIAPSYVETQLEAVRNEPIESFGYGIVILIGLIVVAFLLAISIIGLLFVIPLVLAAYLVWAVGATIAYLAIADRLVDRDGEWTKPLLVAAAINGALALTGIGGLLSVIIGATGFGAVVRSWLSS